MPRETITTPSSLIEQMKEIRGMMFEHLGNPKLKNIKGVKAVKMPLCEGGGVALTGEYFDKVRNLLDSAEEYLEAIR